MSSWKEKLERLRTSPLGTFERYVYDYLEWRRSGKGQNLNTLQGVYLYMSMFVSWCGMREIRSPQEVTLSVLERYRSQVMSLKNKKDGQEISHNQKHKRLAVVKDYLTWLVRKRELLLNPSLDWEIPKYVKSNIPHNVLSVEEAERILAIPDVSDVFGLRDRAMLEVVYSTGIRRMELGNLHVRDIDFEAKTLLVREGKGKKTRLIPISDRALSWVKKYLTKGRAVLSRNDEEKSLYLSKYGFKMDVNNITSIFSGYRKAAGVEKKQSVHIFRHTTATGMLDNGADIRHVQEMLGHADLSTTQIYTHVAIRKLKEVYDKTHPSLHTPDSSSLVGGASPKKETGLKDKDSNQEESNTS
ncbi:tyrosine-type recombinase/integrase [Leptospira weilii]|uniref:tyrosine-type recombinase/integrase n=1 Tax=Leptospira weilii TaxID=28184 RepID=UPI001EF1737E|nr:tyrosine-type recombinase/integrase [Leptospira weilii]ULH27604.1 tyrosine-type recombinase/integrase [Leptospira weilii]ULH27618.1 tyrosine-type recombinase/integrase [Leptospira weilii]UPY77374.1 tyrosine-type recombinase/integrase [Leptospira weilii]UPY77397.1 tyrosine-type recombinase/integrase [Leptospira weilii]